MCACLQAMQCAEEGLRQNAESQMLHIQRGHLYMRRADPQAASKDFSLALGSPIEMVAYKELVAAYLQLGSHKKVC